MAENPFKNWTDDDVRKHQARVLGEHTPPGAPATAIAPPVPRRKVRARPRMVLDDLKLNRTERRLLDEILRPQFVEVGCQRITLRIADACRYTADFDTVDEEGNLILWDAKGGLIRDDSTVKMKVAAAEYPWIRIIMAQWKKKEWTFHEYSDRQMIIHRGRIS